MTMRRHSRRVGQLSTSWLDVGQGEVVVALHGLPTSSTLFEPLVPYLGRYHLIAPDLLGQGDTQTPAAGKLGFAAYYDHLSQFMREVVPGTLHLIVHDLGGLLGLRWARENRERVKSLAILSTLYAWDMRWAVLLTLIHGGNIVLGRSLVDAAVRASLKRQPDESARELMSDWSRPWARWRALRGFDHFAPRYARQNRRGLADWKVPTLIVWGEVDGVFPLSHGKRFVANIPGAELVTIADCGHWSPIDAPQTVGPAIAAFLDRVCGPVA